jgi:hypothetical protein
MSARSFELCKLTQSDTPKGEPIIGAGDGIIAGEK